MLKTSGIALYKAYFNHGCYFFLFEKKHFEFYWNTRCCGSKNNNSLLNRQRRINVSFFITKTIFNFKTQMRRNGCVAHAYPIFLFSSPVIMDNHWPPTKRCIVFVSVFQGFGSYHFSNNSPSVQARQTFLSGALNVLEIRIDFSFKSFTTRFLGVVAILFWFKSNTSNGLIQNLLLFIRIEKWTIEVNLFFPNKHLIHVPNGLSIESLLFAVKHYILIEKMM